MNLSDRIKQKTDQVIAKFAKPKPQPQPTHGTVTGFEQGLIQVSTSEGQQLRQQQGTRAIGVGDQVVAHDNTAVFTGEAGVLPKPGRVFIAAPAVKKLGYFYLYRYREFTPASVAIAQARMSQFASHDFVIQSQSEPAVDLGVLANADFQTTLQRDKIIVSNGNGLAVEVPGWESDVLGENTLDVSTRPNPRVIVQDGQILVIWSTVTTTGGQRINATPFSGFNYADTHIVRFNQKLEVIAQETKSLWKEWTNSIPPFHTSTTRTTQYFIVPELDYANYSRGLKWLPPDIDGIQIGYLGGPNAPELGGARFEYYTLDKPFGPLDVLGPNLETYDYERIRETLFGRNSTQYVNYALPGVTPARATLVQRINYYSPPQDRAAELERLAAIVNAPGYPENPEKVPYFAMASIWKNDIASYTVDLNQ
jgi:hypothetical protein